jgi:hypothetical protein
MPNQLSISNSALIKLGATPLVSIEDDTKEGRLCKVQFPVIRDEVLRSHPWNFAIKRVSLAATANTPVFRFSTEFQLPQDCLRVLTTDLDDGTTEEYAIEGDKFLADVSSVKIRYISNDVAEGLWDENFAEAFAMRMAADLAYAITNSVTVAQHWLRMYDLWMKSARSFDSQEGFSDNKVIAQDWINSRY